MLMPRRDGIATVVQNVPSELVESDRITRARPDSLEKYDCVTVIAL